MRQHFNRWMLARFFALTLTILALIAASAKATFSTHADARSASASIAAAPAPQSSPCVATVPKAWGEREDGEGALMIARLAGANWLLRRRQVP